MKVVQFLPSFLPFVGGIQTYADAFAMALRDRGHSVMIVTFQAKQERIGLSRNPFYSVLVLPSVDVVYNFPVPAVWRRDFWKEFGHVAEFGADVVVSHTRFFTSALLAALAARKEKKPWVHIEHGTSFVKHGSFLVRACAFLYDLTFGQFVLRSADRLVGVSGGVSKFVKLLSGRVPEIFYRGFSRGELPTPLTKAPNVGFIGRIVRSKGVFDLAEAFAQIIQSGKNPKARLVFAGDGPDLAALKKHCDKLKIADRTVFLGNVDPVDVYSEFYDTISICTNPSYTEWLPTTVAEALFSKNAVIATDVGWTCEIAPESEDFVLLKTPGDVSALAWALEKLLKNDAYLKVRGGSYDAVVAKFSWDALVGFLEGVGKANTSVVKSGK